ncbi:MAG: acetamidase/formamidase family protein [Anaerolineaceae bacterium]|nr:acetamidase/formamidase family protein [Anaerolineaceae bacterium]
MLHTLTKEHVVYRFDRNLPAALKVSSGDIIQIETADCFGGSIRSENDVISSEININQANPVTGPVYVEGLTPNDSLELEILDIRLNPEVTTGLMQGVGLLSKNSHPSTLKGNIVGEEIKICGFNIPVKPMIGTIGTAPAGDPVPSLLMGLHGGNMDHPSAARYSKIYLPVEVKGGLFALGDLHGAMGDGEITALSAEGSGWVTLRVEIIKNIPIKRPFFKTPDAWVTTGNASDLKVAIAIAAEEMVEILCKEYALDRDRAVVLMGLAGDIRISQCAGVPGMDASVRCTMPVLKRDDETRK